MCASGAVSYYSWASCTFLAYVNWQNNISTTTVILKCIVITTDRGPSSMLQLVHGFQFGNGGDHDTMPGLVCLSPDSSNCRTPAVSTNNDTGSSFDSTWQSNQHTTPHFTYITTTTTTVLCPFFRDHPGEQVPEENFWTSWCKGRLTEADTKTIRLGATPSGLTSAHLHHPPIF